MEKDVQDKKMKQPAAAEETDRKPAAPKPEAEKQPAAENAPGKPEEARPSGEKPEKGGKPAVSAKEQPPRKSGEELEKEIDQLQKKLKEAEEKEKEEKDLLLRTAAEYDNFRKRTAREKESAYSDAVSETVQDFLPVEDNLERALAQKECSVQDLRKGVEMVQKQMQTALQKLGVEEMGKEGEPFDPGVHNAIAHVEDKKSGKNTVTKVYQKGYKIGDKVVRHAMVQVAN